MQEPKVPKVVTLANLAECTDQEVFDHVSYRMAQQHWQQSMASNGAGDQVCTYRGTKSRCCAAGCCITDAEYRAMTDPEDAYSGFHVEGSGWSDLVYAERVPAAHEALISRLQNAHDRGDTPGAMRFSFCAVADAWHLSRAFFETLPA